MDTQKRPFHEIVAAKLVKQLREGTAPWQKPWLKSSAADFLPFNPITGNRYKGINALHLMSEERDDPRWLTYKQAASLDAQVRKGEKGTQIQFWKFTEEQVTPDAAGTPTNYVVELERPRIFVATVFNAGQIDGLAPRSAHPGFDWDPIEHAEKILIASGANIRHGEHDRAYYCVGTDSIHLPDPSRFPTPDNYYAVALHELGHWTGHELRLNRDLSHPFGSEGYAREELRAEIASLMLSQALQIGHDPQQHAAYVGSWIKMLQDDPFEIFRAAADAEKIQEYVIALSRSQVLDRTTESIMPTQIEAKVNSDEPKKARQLARTNEVPVRRDSNGTDEDIAVARAVGKDAKFDATMADTDLQRRIEREERKLSSSISSPGVENSEKTFLNVPYKEKEEAKALGAKWDRQQQSWFVSAAVDMEPFARWLAEARPHSADVRGSPEAKQTERVYLAVPYSEHSEAKAAGAAWDGKARSWYAGPKADMAKLEKWMLEHTSPVQMPAMTPQEEFAEALKSVGCIFDGDHPIMDGQKHRISVEGEKFSKHSGSGFYVGHLDGHPAGYVKNNKSGDELTWKSKGYTLSASEKARLAAEAAGKLTQREAELLLRQEQAAARVREQLATLSPVQQPTAYMVAKGIGATVGAYTDKHGGKTYLPVHDVDGNQWGMQYIREDGTKRFAKDSKKDGCFHVVGSVDALASAPAIVICEGYATAASLSESLGYATVAAFDSGNLAPVAIALQKKFPGAPIVIAGDDDTHLELTQGVNSGRTKAVEAARQVNGTLLLPVFAPGENKIPVGVEPVSREAYRLHLKTGDGLSDEQLAALGNMKQHTDFNDLANKSAFGRDDMVRQVRPMIEAAIERQKFAHKAAHGLSAETERPRRRSSIKC